MEWNEHLKIPKKQKQVTLWIHPEGKVVGSLFLHLQNRYYTGEEEPREALNHPDPFLVLKRDDFDELRFYNKASIIRVEYPGELESVAEGIELLHCRMFLMDGSIVEGAVQRALPPDHARLYDYLNMDGERFAELYTPDGTVCLVNKSYVVFVTPLVDPSGRAGSRQQSDEVAGSRYEV